jgi:hypothetical protein
MAPESDMKTAPFREAKATPLVKIGSDRPHPKPFLYSISVREELLKKLKAERNIVTIRYLYIKQFL